MVLESKLTHMIKIRLLELNKFKSSNLVVWIQSYEFSKRYATLFLVGGSTRFRVSMSCGLVRNDLKPKLSHVTYVY